MRRALLGDTGWLIFSSVLTLLGGCTRFSTGMLSCLAPGSGSLLSILLKVCVSLGILGYLGHASCVGFWPGGKPTMMVVVV